MDRRTDAIGGVSASRTTGTFYAETSDITHRRCRLHHLPQPLPRAFRRQLQALDSEKGARIVREAGDEPEITSSAGATAPGDERRLRGIPAVSRHTSGAVFGSDPVRALLAKESRRGR